MQARVSIVTLGSHDLDRSVRFYETLGFEARRVHPGVVLFQTLGPVLALCPWDEMAAAAHVDPTGSGFRGQRLTCHLSSASEVRVAYREWLAAGGYSVREPADRDTGAYAAIVADPDAHLWELVHNPRNDVVRFNMFGQLELS